MSEEQKKELLALIGEEKAAFIHAEYGRLQSAMGMEYTEGGEPRVFHPLPDTHAGTGEQKGENQPMGNPEELSLAELAELPHLMREVPRLGTLSLVPLFRTSPDEAERLRLLADIQEKLLIDKPCLDSAIARLLDGHEAFLASKRDDDVIIIK